MLKRCEPPSTRGAKDESPKRGALGDVGSEGGDVTGTDDMCSSERLLDLSEQEKTMKIRSKLKAGCMAPIPTPPEDTGFTGSRAAT
jgi:hypothetical protein